MSTVERWITPFTKQCFVTLGVSLNMMQPGMMAGFPAILLPQLKKDKDILIDDSTISWICAIQGSGLFIGILITPILMSKLGRRNINLLAVIMITFGWLILYIASTITMIISARFLQGVASGFTAFLCSVLIGEYTSPVYRGPFLNTITSALLSGILIIHTAGSYLCWNSTSLVPAAIGMVDIVIILYSPDSPTYLAMKGRYEDCKKTFRWLRGDKEDEELHKMLKTFEKSVNLSRSKNFISVMKSKKRIIEILNTIKSKSFYMPIIIMMHLNVINLWSGVIVYDNFAIDIYNTVIGTDVNIANVIISMDIQLVLTNVLSAVIIKRFRRKSVLLVTTLLNITAWILLSVYTLAKVKGVLYFDHPSIGIILGHFHIFSLSIGPVSLPNIIVGEIFPIKYRGIGGTISILFFSICLAITMKVTPFLFTNLGIYGTFSIFAAFVTYGLIVTLVCLPETKDKTLQEIEEKFVKGDKNVNENEPSLLDVHLTSKKSQSNPIA